MNNRTPNQLINSKSPYLLQHAYNPVEWHPWNKTTLEKAKQENKLLLISIGYSACHWCHVMERESFENETVAQLMNAHFINIKIDREERPDVDQVYMQAVQIMMGHGGWPLNCIALPDGRPVYGGTYFPKERWIQILNSLAELWINDKEKMFEYAEKLHQGMKADDLDYLTVNTELNFENLIKETIDKWKLRLDNINGGPDKAPKFPLPNNYQFLLHYAHLYKDEEMHQHIQLTLNKMATGGIYDYVGGGFARYSVDAYWKIPHFEKMLYDNGQLLSLYADAYKAYGNELYADVIRQTISFLNRELRSKGGAYYSALDADSEGVEGKYYVWTKEEIKSIGITDKHVLNFLGINNKGYWEEGNYVIMPDITVADFCKKEKLNFSEFQEKIDETIHKLLITREKRIKPGLDNKIISGWNGMVIKGLCDAYLALGDKYFLHDAIQAWEFLVSSNTISENHIHRMPPETESIDGFLEDYVWIAEASLGLYSATLKEEYIFFGQNIIKSCFKKFFDGDSGFFYYSENSENDLIVRMKELQDNVIPASNSMMASLLIKYGTVLENKYWIETANSMLNRISDAISSYGSAYSQWLKIALNNTHLSYEIIISGDNYESLYKELQMHYLPNLLILAGANNSKLPMLQNRFVENKTYIYPCVQKTCKMPVENIDELLRILQE